MVLGAPAGAKLENGRLADIAPTMLALMGIEKPAAMTGHSLLKKATPAPSRKNVLLLAANYLADALLRVRRYGAMPRDSGDERRGRARRCAPIAATRRRNRRMDLSQGAAGAPAWTTCRPAQQQLGALKDELAKSRPGAGRRQGEKQSLAAEAAALRQKLIDTAARIKHWNVKRSVLGGADRAASVAGRCA